MQFKVGLKHMPTWSGVKAFLKNSGLRLVRMPTIVSSSFLKNSWKAALFTSKTILTLTALGSLSKVPISKGDSDWFLYRSQNDFERLPLVE